ncbi:MAG: tetratricopeptide repeat protein [Gammaproteobacteria bacterium]
MPVTFILLALAMCVVASLFILLPAWKSSHNGESAWLSAGIFALITLGGTAAFYNVTGGWNWSPDGVPDSPVAKQLYELQRAVHDNENDAAGWAELGRFYLQFDQVDTAIEAFDRSLRISQGRDIETNLNLVEALAMRGAPNDQVRSAEILNASLKINPGHRKALWYASEVAAGLGQWDVAIARWQVMLNDAKTIDTDEARSVVSLLTERIATAQQQKEGVPVLAGSSDKRNAPEAVRIRVALDQGLSTTPSLMPSTNLFVFVRSKEQGGPPLAVHRSTVGQLPLDIVMSDADAMMPGRMLSAYDDLEIVARVALGGKPTMTPGDLFGRHELSSGESRDVEISIDQVARAL